MVIRAQQSTGGTRTADADDIDGELDLLINRVATADEEAFAKLYGLIAGPILGITTRVLRDHARSEEVAQEVLLEVWLKAPQFCEQGGKVMAWIVTMAHRRAIDRIRHEQASVDREGRAGQLDVQRPIDETVEATMARLEKQQVRNALNGLSDLQRQSIVLAYYHGYTYREVAEVLETPIGTVKSRMREGLLRLRECLGAQQ